MSTAAYEEVAAAAQALSPEEQRQLCEMLVALQKEWDERAKHQQVLQKALEDGVITRIPPPIRDFTPYRNRKLIEVKGKPLSETIIEDRR